MWTAAHTYAILSKLKVLIYLSYFVNILNGFDEWNLNNYGKLKKLKITNR